jgi:siroheme synthase
MKNNNPHKIKQSVHIGAGIGDPGLITVRGKECLHLADVVFMTD